MCSNCIVVASVDFFVICSNFSDSLQKIKVCHRSIDEIKISPNGALIAIKASDGHVRVININLDQLLTKLKEKKNSHDNDDNDDNNDNNDNDENASRMQTIFRSQNINSKCVEIISDRIVSWIDDRNHRMYFAILINYDTVSDEAYKWKCIERSENDSPHFSKYNISLKKGILADRGSKAKFYDLKRIESKLLEL